MARDVINEEVERLKVEDPKAVARYNPGPSKIRLLILLNLLQQGIYI